MKCATPWEDAAERKLCAVAKLCKRSINAVVSSSKVVDLWGIYSYMFLLRVGCNVCVLLYVRVVLFIGGN